MDRRRSTRLRSQIRASEDGAGAGAGAGLDRRRSPRLHPRTQASEDGAGLARRRSPRLHPQIRASEEGASSMTSRRASPASLPDDDDILREILLRLPPTPSSLARASAVCTRWRGLLADPKFHRQLCARHRNPPLLGSFVPNDDDGQRIVFAPMLDPPDRIPPPRFDLGRCGHNTDVLGCRHGRVLVKTRVWDADGGLPSRVIVCDPITGDQRTVAFPPDLGRVSVNGAVLCAAAESDPGHMHGSCHSSPFKLVLVTMYRRHPNRLLACVYSSNTGLWGDLISSESPSDIHGKPAVLIGNRLYWLSVINGSILEFDLDENRIAVMMGPPVTHDERCINHQIIKAENGAVGYAMLVYPSLIMWKRDVDAHGVTTWVPWKIIGMDTTPGHPPRTERRDRIQGYDEDTDVVLLHVNGTVYMLDLKSLQSTMLSGPLIHIGAYHPLRCFYTPVIREGHEVYDP
ncbi:uncharacterized protein [Lolium perenne]|uniref:uncharacterized protein n=1 Tax=Lolium perenne TaxID=4522 RepID=UPI0021F62306|nr:uncharacterized protein LOC127314898 isoform X1 [Lolium perenne]XP_051201394.1 uncharacterized protein LOC127314898 isoform X1 [Lolium perenne]XP_051201395.1 uncharacterized protein LOC127314898 isoform X1 [Lolium perenne]XP_051201398.1 uncharacterized protein LOC127314898 isoform X4 [Lolium perenne]XP_051201400.1 uncharacterized protein LOC127314898 isoform X5 [Lolium perenne]XP_051201401.1 uncharacterized protein LOC127314898 isoform X4 [Lolium perenne]XP_051201402.1 uncharacterized prot